MTDFQTIYREQARKVYRYLLCLTGSEDAAEELLSETFYQAMLHIGRFRGECSIFTWLCAIGKNLWRKEQKRLRHISTLSEGIPELINAFQTPEDDVIRRDEARRILRIAESLPDRLRMVFLLRTVGQLPFKEIADIFEKSENWARVTYYRARQKITEEVLK